MKAIVTSGYAVPLKPELYEGLHVFRNMYIKQVKKKKFPGNHRVLQHDQEDQAGAL